MSTHSRATDGSADDDVHPLHLHGTTEDVLIERITRAMRSREVVSPDASVVATRIEDQLAQAPGRLLLAGRGQGEQTAFVRRGGRIVVVGVAASALAVVGAGAAAASNPYSNIARVVESAAQAVGIEWSAMPDGYTREQYEAFWGAGYSAGDVDTLSQLWSTGATETKARAGQMILDGQTPPVPASEAGPQPVDGSGSDDGSGAQRDAFWHAGYSAEDAEELAALWNLDVGETKVAAGQKILDGQSLPVPPSGTPTRATETPHTP